MTTKFKISLIFAICGLLSGSALSYAQTALPPIDIGQRHKTTSGIIKRSDRPLQEARAPASRVIVPVANGPTSASSPPTASSGDSNQSFASSAQQNTALGPKIDYPAGPKEQSSS